jgi:hypothetical protein
MQEEKKNIKDMTLEEHLEYNRLFIRKLRETPEYRKHEKEYKEQNKEAINARTREKITCTCGCVISRGNLSRHQKNKQHLKFMESNKIL